MRGNCVGMVGFFEGSHVKLMQSILDISEVDDLELSQPLLNFLEKENNFECLWN